LVVGYWLLVVAMRLLAKFSFFLVKQLPIVTGKIPVLQPTTNN
jgi:hypothetical protein